MKDNERLISALKQSIENEPDIELGKFIRYITSVSDLAYMTVIKRRPKIRFSVL